MVRILDDSFAGLAPNQGLPETRAQSGELVRATTAHARRVQNPVVGGEYTARYHGSFVKPDLDRVCYAQ